MASPFIGQITMFGGNFAPRNWAFCNGQLVAISQNSALFSLLGTTYGGDGRVTFALPDLRGRAPIHFGNGPGLAAISLGQKGGAETVTLNVNQIPAHDHAVNASATSTAKAVAPAGNSNDAVGNFWADDAGVSSGTYHTGAGVTPGNMNAGAIVTDLTVDAQPAGGNQSHENRSPFLAVSYIIALQGVFPSRS